MKIFLKVLAVLVGLGVLLTAGSVAWHWQPDRSVTDLKARWAPPPSVYVEVAGMQVHMRDEGVRDDPLPIVLLHGTSASLHTWDGWVDGLKPTRRLIRLDLPGYGLTGPFPDHNYRSDHYATFMHAFLDKLGIERCVLVGNSFGGQIAIVTALAKPARVERLVLVDSSGYPLAPKSIPMGFLMARMPLLNQITLLAMPRGLVEDSVRSVYGDPARVTPTLVDRYFELSLREGNRLALVQRMKQVSADVITKRMAEVKVPTLILWGGRDRLIPVAAVQRFSADIVGSRHVIFDDLGHVPHEEDPVRTLAAAMSFLGRDNREP